MKLILILIGALALTSCGVYSPQIDHFYNPKNEAGNELQVLNDSVYVHIEDSVYVFQNPYKRYPTAKLPKKLRNHKAVYAATPLN